MRKAFRFANTMVVLLALCLAAVSCGGKEAPPGQAPERAMAMKEIAPSLAGDKGEVPAPAEARRKVITSWDLALETDRVEEALGKAMALAEAAGGYLTGTSRNRADDGRLFASLSMRLPPGRVPGVLDQLRALGKVTRETSTGEDITEAYYDLEARLRNQKAAEDRLLKLLARQADKLKDILDVERELTRVRGEIESMEARKRNWDLLTGTVSVRVEFSEPARALPAFRRIWDPVRTAFGDALEGFAHSLHYLVVFLGVAVPWLVLAGLLFLLVRFYFRKRMKGV